MPEPRPFCVQLTLLPPINLLDLLFHCFFCAGVGVMMLLALTVERYVSVCHPGRNQPFMGPPRLIVSLIPLMTFLLYLPNVFRNELKPCLPSPEGPISYQRQDNRRFLNSVFYSMYKVCGNLTNIVVEP